MKKFLITILALGASFSYAKLNKNDVLDDVQTTANYYIKDPRWTDKLGNLNSPKHTFAWHYEPFYDGLLKLSLLTGDSKYLAELIRRFDEANWKIGAGEGAKNPFMADGVAVGKTYLDIYLLDETHTERMLPSQKVIDYAIKSAQALKAEGVKHPDPKTYSKWVTHGSTPIATWAWCDALYMANGLVANLYKATGDKKYLEYLNEEFKWTYDLLYSPEYQLYFRDYRFLPRIKMKKFISPNGKPIFWGRGNGWVVGALVAILQALPDNEPSKEFYVKLLQDMCASLIKYRKDDGLWTSNILDNNDFPESEVSGSGFFLYAIGWGINNGYLDKEKYLPILEKGWEGLKNLRKENGFIGYVQPEAASPYKTNPTDTHTYGAGVYMLTGIELAKALGAKQTKASKEILEAAQEQAKHLEKQKYPPAIIIKKK